MSRQVKVEPEPSVRAQSRHWRSRPLVLIGKGAPPVIALALLICAWQFAVSVSGIDPTILPSPARVLEQGWAQRSELGYNARATLEVTLVGFAFSVVIAWVIAVVVDFSPILRRAIVPVLVASQTIPIIAVAPLLIVWFGFGLLPKVLVVALSTFFAVTIGLIEGFNHADPETSGLLKSMGAGRLKEFRYVRLPSALPSFFTALRISITYAVVGAIFAEYAGAATGLGIYMSIAKNAYRTDLVLAAVVVTAALSIALFALTFLVERLVIPWSFKERKRRKA